MAEWPPPTAHSPPPTSKQPTKRAKVRAYFTSLQQNLREPVVPVLHPFELLPFSPVSHSLSLPIYRI